MSQKMEAETGSGSCAGERTFADEEGEIEEEEEATVHNEEEGAIDSKRVTGDEGERGESNWGKDDESEGGADEPEVALRELGNRDGTSTRANVSRGWECCREEDISLEGPSTYENLPQIP